MSSQPVIAIGVFDGVHRGHERMLQDAHALARDLGAHADVTLPVWALTFFPHPEQVVRGSAPPMLMTLGMRLHYLHSAGVERVEVLAFTQEFSRLSPEQFVRQYIVDRYNAAGVVVGANFRFGHKAEGDVGRLTDLCAAANITVRTCDLVADASGDAVSSSRVREAIVSGEMHEAARLLGRHVRIAGVVVDGLRRGRELGFPTANIRPHTGFVHPADGVYAARCRWNGTDWPTAVSVGEPPQFDDGDGSVVEAHLIGFDGDLYGRHLAVDLIERLRPQQKYENLDALMEAIAADVARTVDLAATNTPPLHES